MHLEIRQERKDTTLLLHITGVMDYSTVDGMICDIPEGICRLTFELSGLDFIDSTGIGSVLSMIYEANDRRVQVTFEGLNEIVKELFDTVGVFRIIQSLQQRG
jgi:anti-anti-sigma factor